MSTAEVAAAVRRLPPITDAQAVRIAALLNLAIRRKSLRTEVEMVPDGGGER